MKKIILLAAAVLSTVTAFPQISSTSFQTESTTSANTSAEAGNRNIATALSSPLDGALAEEAKSSHENHGQTVANVAQSQTTAEGTTAKNHGQAVAEVAQGAQSSKQGDKVKEVATTKRKAKPAKVKTQGGARVTGGASRAAGMVKPGTAAQSGGAARVHGNAKATGKVARPVTKARPVQVGGAVGVGSRIKVGKN